MSANEGLQSVLTMKGQKKHVVKVPSDLTKKMISLESKFKTANTVIKDSKAELSKIFEEDVDRIPTDLISRLPHQDLIRAKALQAAIDEAEIDLKFLTVELGIIYKKVVLSMPTAEHLIEFNEAAIDNEIMTITKL